MGARARIALVAAALLGASAGHAAEADAPLRTAAVDAPRAHVGRAVGTGPATLEGRLHAALDRLERRLAAYPDDYEASLLRGLLHFQDGRIERALAELDGLTRRAPKFHLAYLIRGDLLLSQTRTLADIGAGALLERGAGEGEELENLRQEAKARLRAYLQDIDLQSRLPRELLRLGEEVEAAILVDKSRHRLYVYRRDAEGGVPRLVRDYYVSTGKLNGNKEIRGDLRTPEGVYFVTRYIPDAKLPAKYGVGAFPVDYPNEWDRRQGKTGYGIWLHGTDDAFYSRPPLDSEGCVVLPNIDLGRVSEYITPGKTPVIIAEQLDWVSEAQWKLIRREVAQAVEAWRRDWESGDVERYLSHYAGDFWSGDHDRASWVARKRRVARGKTYQDIDIANMSLLAYPRSADGERDIIVATFEQRYRSNNFSSDMTKELYLVREQGGWQVLYEGGR